jgi:hypothetical protein
MKTKTIHHLVCEGNICAGYPTEGLTWFPDEAICTKRPFTKWQRKQMKIKKLAVTDEALRDTFFTVSDLMQMQRVRTGIRGRNPDARQVS